MRERCGSICNPLNSVVSIVWDYVKVQRYFNISPRDTQIVPATLKKQQTQQVAAGRRPTGDARGPRGDYRGDRGDYRRGPAMPDKQVGVGCLLRKFNLGSRRET